MPIFGEIFAIFLGAILVENEAFGRKKSVLLGYLITIASCLMIYFTEFFISASLIGKAGISLTFAVVYPLCNELYPTTIRGIGVSFGNSFGRLGSILMPWVALPLLNV